MMNAIHVYMQKAAQYSYNYKFTTNEYRAHEEDPRTQRHHAVSLGTLLEDT